MTARPTYLVTVTLEDGTAVFHGGSDNLLLRNSGDRHPAMCVVVAEDLMSWAGPQQLSDTITPPLPTDEFGTQEHILLSPPTTVRTDGPAVTEAARRLRGLGPTGLRATFDDAPTTSSRERAAFFADKLQHLLGEIALYEDTHPDDAPCLDGQRLTIDSKIVTLRLAEKGLH